VTAGAAATGAATGGGLARAAGLSRAAGMAGEAGATASSAAATALAEGRSSRPRELVGAGAGGGRRGPAWRSFPGTVTPCSPSCVLPASCGPAWAPGGNARAGDAWARSGGRVRPANGFDQHTHAAVASDPPGSHPSGRASTAACSRAAAPRHPSPRRWCRAAATRPRARARAAARRRCSTRRPPPAARRAAPAAGPCCRAGQSLREAEQRAGAFVGAAGCGQARCLAVDPNAAQRRRGEPIQAGPTAS
jgi:hypothetical protein